MLNVIRDLAKEGMTMLIVTHEMDFALSISLLQGLDGGRAHPGSTPRRK
ncbi:hypothetical protein ACVBEG_27110 [Pseudomonas sp. GG8]